MSTRTEYRDRLIEANAELTRLREVNAELVRALEAAQERLHRAMTKGRGNDFYAAIVAVEQDLRAALARGRA